MPLLKLAGSVCCRQDRKHELEQACVVNLYISSCVCTVCCFVIVVLFILCQSIINQFVQKLAYIGILINIDNWHEDIQVTITGTSKQVHG